MGVGSSDVPRQVVVAAYHDEQGADEALKTLKEIKREGLINIEDAAVIRKDPDGKLHIKETADMSTGRGAGIGALVGGVIGLLAGPAGVVVGAGAGALVGGLAAKGDAGIKDERLEKIGEGLEPGTSAIVAIVDHEWVDEVRRQIQEEARDVMTEEISADIHEQLVAGKEVGYTAIAAGDAVVAGRVAGDEEGAEVSGIVVTDEGVAAVTAEEGLPPEIAPETEDAVTDETVVATDETKDEGTTPPEEEAKKDA
jgi:uncharacterized membrane protein